jgi:putative N6-adenine-specific DNA methylase
MTEKSFSILLVTAPGLEAMLAAEAREKHFHVTDEIAGGVELTGTWPDVWRANLELRGAARVLARIGSFRAAHLAQLDKRARAFPWRDFLRADFAVNVEATCKKSRIYHSGAAAQRVATAINEELGAEIREDADLTVMARIEDDLVTLSVDTSGELLHKRGSKQAMAKAPMRENMASLFLRMAGFDGKEPIYDPMCGSGTFVIEAAEWAQDLQPGRNREFAFEKLKTFDQSQWVKLKHAEAPPPSIAFHGSDRDAGAVKASIANATRANVSASTQFSKKSISEITPPEGPPDGPSGLVIINAPYGTRIGEEKKLQPLYASLGRVLQERFNGWRIGIITSNKTLANATGLTFSTVSKPVLHGGLRIYLFQTQKLS